MSLKESVKRECRQRNITQAELAEQLGMKPSNFNNQINRDDTVQLGLIKKICKELSVSVGSMFDSDSQHSNSEEEQMIYDQLKAILDNGDEDTVDLIVGKITREYMRVQTKKESSLESKLA